jgi:hypothetical protein
MVKRRTLGVVGDKAFLFKGLPERCHDADGFLIIDLGEQIDVFGRAIDEPVRDHGPTTGEGQCVRLGECKGDSGDSVLQGIQRHVFRLPCVLIRSADATPTAPIEARTSHPRVEPVPRR